MGKILVIAEKPDAGSNMAKVLGCTERQKGYIEGEKYVVTWAVGHLIGLKMPEEHDERLKDWKMDSLPLVFDIENSLKVLPETASQFAIVKKLIHRNDIDYLINAGDAGREGYLIQSWIYRVAGNTKPVKILWASSLTDEALRKAFANLKEEDVFFRNLLEEAEARAEADYLMGMNYSRVITLTKSRDITLSYGRCQTPLLNLIVKRDEEIEQFVSKPFYQIQAIYDKGFKAFYIGEDGKTLAIESQEEAAKLQNRIKGKQAKVISCEKEEKKKKAPLLFSLGELQKEMGRRYKYTPDQTLAITQRLYETHKIVSYPRTESSYLTMDLYNEIAEHINSCNFGPFASVIAKINSQNIKADKSYFNDAKVTDHHALIPTINDHIDVIYQKLDEEEKKVFDAIAYRFLAIFYPAYEYATTTVYTECEDLRFKSQGTCVINLGYKEVLKDQSKEDEGKEEQIPLLQAGDSLYIKEAEVLSKKTSPPPRYTVESIITLMQKYHIGTSATMAEIIKKLQNPKRQYITLDNGTYKSTTFGRKFIKVVPEHLKSPDLTKEIEAKLLEIEDGKLSKKEFLDEIIQQITSYIDTVKNDAAPDFGKEPLGVCPKCGTPVYETRFAYECETADCFRIGKQICGKAIVRKMAQDILKTGKTGCIKGFKGKTGRSFDARLVWKNGKVEFEFPQKQR